ncbi:YdcF family protein [Paenibacillus sp. GCM10023252]|uniref:YdcF family protein n=1 Tax=Paenibacillus sp. GCM10023252 TaxID=3252649 RepID=UPI003615604D
MRAAVNKGSRARRRRGAAGPWLLLRRIAAWCVVAGVMWCGYLLWLINNYDYSKDVPAADAGIVLGASLWDDQPSPALRERLEFAYSLYEQGKVPLLILTGGLDGNGSKLTEAEGMKKYLVERGVPADKLILENYARSTYENLKLSQVLVQERELSSLLIVTHDYHASRASDIAEYLGYDQFVMAAFPSEVLPPLKNEAREVLAYTKWKVDRLLLPLGFRSPDPL